MSDWYVFGSWMLDVKARHAWMCHMLVTSVCLKFPLKQTNVTVFCFFLGCGLPIRGYSHVRHMSKFSHKLISRHRLQGQISSETTLHYVSSPLIANLPKASPRAIVCLSPRLPCPESQPPCPSPRLYRFLLPSRSPRHRSPPRPNIVYQY